MQGREHGVLELVVAGLSNKAIARDLGLSHRTVEIHRRHVMDKMEAGSYSELVIMAIAGGISCPEPGLAQSGNTTAR